MDVLHVHHPFVSGRLALRYRRGPSQPVVFTSHTRYDLHADAYLPPGLRALGRYFLLALLRGFCRRCDRALAPTERMRARLREWGVGCPIEVIALGLDLEPFRRVPISPGATAGNNVDPADGTVVAIFVGRLGPEKNLDLLLESFAAVAGSRPRFELVVAGDGPQRKRLEERAASLAVDDRIRFAGMVAHEEVANLLRRADLFVTPSLTEVQPLSVLEAMAAGLPVLGLESAGVGDLVDDGATGARSNVPWCSSSTTSAVDARWVPPRERRPPDTRSKRRFPAW
jgi:glycosyltransferase involved in cell wall biosynthesis